MSIDSGCFDVHAHVMPLGRPAIDGLAETIIDQLPHAVDDGGGRGRIVSGARDFRIVRASLWDVERRLAELDDLGIAHQAISPVPVALLDHHDEATAVGYARWFNHHLAKSVEAGAGRLHGIGMVPLPHVAAACRELDHLHEHGIRSIEIGTRIANLELDDPALRRFWAVAAETGTTVFIHPREGGRGAIRRSGFLWDFGLGMLTDTALAAGALVFGGVLREFPEIRVVMAHGCGTFARAYPRLRLAESISHPGSPSPDPLLRSIWVDSLILDRAELLGAINRFGADRVMVGSDYPFIDGQPDASHDDLRALAARGELDADDVAGIQFGVAAALFGLRSHTADHSPTTLITTLEG